MPQPIFSNNPADWTAVEGLAISETLAPAGIKGVALNQVAVVGECVRGPKDKPVLVSSPARFAEVFGGRDKGSGGDILGKVWQGLLNKPFGPLYVVRTAPADAVAATRDLVKGATASSATAKFDTQANTANTANGDLVTVTTIKADGSSQQVIFELRKDGGQAAAGHTLVDISSASTADTVAAAFKTALQAAITAGDLSCTAATDADTTQIDLTATVLGTAGNIAISKSGSPTVAATAGTDTTLVTITANGPGTWGNDVSYAVLDAADADATHWGLQITYLGKAYTFQNFNTGTGSDNTLAVLGDDDGLLISLTKVADGRPDDVQPHSTLATGADGTIADTDYTASGRGINLVSAKNGISVVAVAGRSNTVIKAYLKTKAAASPDRLFLCCADSETVSEASAITEAKTLTTGGQGRMVYCFNHAQTLDPETATKIWTEPHLWLASILSQTDVDVHPGEESTKQFTAGITALYNPSLERADYAALRAAGICAFEEDDGGFVFVSGVTTDLVEITDRREIDFLNLSIAGRTKQDVKKKSTARNRRAVVAPIIDFFTQLVKDERVLEKFLVDGNALNTDTTLGENIFQVLIRGRLISHMNFIVAQTEYGTTVQIA